MRVIPTRSLELLHKRGLGDKIAAVANPIARAIDKVARTKIAECAGCKKMRDRLNAGMRLGQAIKKRIKGE